MGVEWGRYYDICVKVRYKTKKWSYLGFLLEIIRINNKPLPIHPPPHKPFNPPPPLPSPYHKHNIPPVSMPFHNFYPLKSASKDYVHYRFYTNFVDQFKISRKIVGIFDQGFKIVIILIFITNIWKILSFDLWDQILD